MPRHYTNSTNWSALDRLKECVGDTALEAELTKVDDHTAYMFQNKYNKKNAELEIT